MTPGPRVSVVIPVWDSPYVETLPDAVESVHHQDPDVPVLVVDNASTQPLPDLDGVTVLRAPARLSEGAARNLGLDQVETEYVVFLDADDLLIDGSLAYLEREIEHDPEIAACATSIIEGKTGERHRAPRRLAYPLSRLRRCFALANAVWSLYPSQGSAILRTAQVRSAGGYTNSDVSEDWALRSPLAFRGRIALRDRPALVYRRHLSRSPLETRGPGALAGAARRVRHRLRSDPAVPRWAKALLPAVALAQLTMIYGVRPIRQRLRLLVSPRPSPREDRARQLEEHPHGPPDIGQPEPERTASRQG
jgi:glycosyltransferase involved in cell wall biosynthesis